MPPHRQREAERWEREKRDRACADGGAQPDVGYTQGTCQGQHSQKDEQCSRAREHVPLYRVLRLRSRTHGVVGHCRDDEWYADEHGLLCAFERGRRVQCANTLDKSQQPECREWEESTDTLAIRAR